MYVLGLFIALLAVTSAEHCYSDVEGACSSTPTASTSPLLSNCNAKYGGFDNLQVDLQAFVNANIETSFEFLLMSAHFGNYEANREGFKAYFRKISDKAWEDAIDVIKFITKRGGRMNFNQLPHFKKAAKEARVLELNELNSLAKALDSQKQLAEEALRIHSQTYLHPKKDASVGHYLEEEFIEPQADMVRTLAGHTTDLKNLLSKNDQDASVSVFLFDEFLKKSL